MPNLDLPKAESYKQNRSIYFVPTNFRLKKRFIQNAKETFTNLVSQDGQKSSSRGAHKLI